MRKDRLYFYTFLSIAVIFIIIASFATRFFVQASGNQILENHLQASKREAKQMASLVGSQLKSGLDQEKIIQQIQESIEGSQQDFGYVSLFDWSGQQICHPDRNQRGQKLATKQSFISSIDGEVTPEDVYQLLSQQGGEENYTENQQRSEIIFQYPVANSDWIIGAHANLSKLNLHLNKLRNRFYAIFTIMGFVIILSSVITVRLIGSLYEKNLESEKRHLEGEVINLAKLNADLGIYQQKVTNTSLKSENTAEDSPRVQKNELIDKGKKRILTYIRNELLPVATDEIAYIYTENTITYVVDIHGKRSTTNTSLDELLSGLDSSYFYRANRQFIIAISAIEKIIRYGNNQLKIVVAPNSEVDIIIGKNKAAEFKQWLNL